MGDRWGPDGPPSEAYSRVTRDLGAVTAEFARHLDELPGRLVGRYDCRVRPVSPEELARLRPLEGRPEVEDLGSYAVEPADPACATLLVLRFTFDRASSVHLAAGVGTVSQAPVCMCDACDEDSPELIGLVEEFVSMVTSGFREFRSGPLPPPPGAAPGEPWQERGYEWSGGRSVGGSSEVRGDSYDAEWQAWPERHPA